jgi:hypothetical protein
MIRWLYFLAVSVSFISCSSDSSWNTTIPHPGEVIKDSNSTPTYEEAIRWWKKLGKSSSRVKVVEFGTTDAGLPLHVVVLDYGRAQKLKAYGSNRKKQLLLINNGIHPGEPDGVNASIELAYQLVTDSSIQWQNTVVAIIPFYNVGGSLRRNSHSRANQNGPESYGFRGNAQNLDLNRDFVKCDSRNARSFAELIQILDPDLYVETHVSNGADYQYTMTYLPAQEDKIGKILGKQYIDEWTPFLRKRMESAQFPMVPYVNVHGTPPDNGYTTFYDSPRYSTGMLTLHHIPGYITETHMLKPFESRVKATYQFLLAAVGLVNTFEIKEYKIRSRQSELAIDTLPIHWEVDLTDTTRLAFMGFEHRYEPSKISGLPRLVYDRNRPYTKPVDYFGTMLPTQWSVVPDFMIIRGGYNDVIDRLKWNGVDLQRIEQDTTMKLRVQYIENTQSIPSPYEGHFLHYETTVHDTIESITVYQGDYWVRTQSDKRRFLVNTLDPRAPDSYFNWNFFDPILQRKEYFSSYVFEDLAMELLKNDTALNNQWEAFKRTPSFNENFKNNARNQLHWIYTHSVYSEPVYRQYPVFQSVQ